MSSALGSRRKGRRIGVEDNEDLGISSSEQESLESKSREQNGSSASRKPVEKSLSSSRRPTKKSSKLKLSFGPGEGEGGEDGGANTELFVPKKSSLSRKALERSASKKALDIPIQDLPIRPGSTDERPSYSKEELQALKTSTPSTPQEPLSDSVDNQDVDDDLNVLAKFGPSASKPENGLILSEAEIREKKERRARLAKEKGYIGLEEEDGSDEGEDGIYEVAKLKQDDKYGETRLVHEDEDIAEGFDDFVEDEQLSLGRNAKKEQQRLKKQEIQEMIDNAEGGSENDESDDSEASRRQDYNDGQIRAGNFGSSRDPKKYPRSLAPAKIPPVPTLQDSINRLQERLAQAEHAKHQKVMKMEELVREKAEIGAREVEIQRLLKEAGDNYEKLRIEAGIGDQHAANSITSGQAAPMESPFATRGLESFGSALPAASRESPGG